MVKFYTVTLDDAQRLLLERTISRGHAPARTTTRARILLKADDGELGPGWSDTRIAGALDVGVATVERVRKRAAQEGIDAVLQDRPRPPRSGKLDDEGEAKLVALSCSSAPDGRDRWTLHLLTQHFTDQSGIPISYELVRGTLKKTSLSPICASSDVSRRRPMPSSSGGWRTSSPSTPVLTIPCVL